MFTPPPSPRPSASKHTPVLHASSSSPTLAPPTIVHAMASHDQKRRTGRRFRWAVLVVPLVLILITASTRYLTHPAAFDVFSSSSSSREWSQLLVQSKDWRLHKRHPSPDPDNMNNSPPPSSVTSTSSSSPAPSPSQTTTAPQSIPTIPSAPPVLPTPFPQPFDSQLTLNFSSVSCLSFFTNMTQSDAFRKCRPFSLLSQSSATFINSNLTLMNTLVWGTCNTNLGTNQCIANMGWFASALNTACKEDLDDRNSLAVDTWTALNAFELMYNAACTRDPQSNTYCYINAVANKSPADLFLYQLPFGIDLPKATTNFTCSTCSQGLLGRYADALSNSTLDDRLTGLKETYESSVKIVNTACGSDFARAGVSSGAPALRLSSGAGLVLTVILSSILIF